MEEKIIVLIEDIFQELDRLKKENDVRNVDKVVALKKIGFRLIKILEEEGSKNGIDNF